MTAPHERDQIDVETLLRMMTSAEVAYPQLDEDRLASNARLVRRVTPDLDAPTVEWLVAAPSPARVDIASVVLETCWHPAFGAYRPDPAHVEALLATATIPGITEEGDATRSRALVRAYEAGLLPALADRVLAALSAALDRPNANPALHPLLRRVLGEH